MIKQLRNGSDLSRVTLPTFILETRSFLERFTDFMLHPQFILGASEEASDEARFLSIVRWYLSGWHIRPKVWADVFYPHWCSSLTARLCLQGVKKPYNPILGEKFRSSWSHDDGSTTTYVAEQVSHHPPVSAFMFSNRRANLLVSGHVHPKSKFLGNSSASILEGECAVHILNRGEVYRMSFPSVYARGILLGTLRMETSGTVSVTCEKTGWEAELEFKNRGLLRGEANSISGKVRRIGAKKELYNISGRWDRQLFIQAGKSAPKDVFFDASADVCRMVVPASEEQGEFESRRLWENVTRCLRAGKIDDATRFKTELEDAQRRGASLRKDSGEQWRPHMFVCGDDGYSWSYRNLDTSPKGDEGVEAEKAGALERELSEACHVPGASA